MELETDNGREFQIFSRPKYKTVYLFDKSVVCNLLQFWWCVYLGTSYNIGSEKKKAANDDDSRT